MDIAVLVDKPSELPFDFAGPFRGIDLWDLDKTKPTEIAHLVKHFVSQSGT